jgi:hypothetical protein
VEEDECDPEILRIEFERTVIVIKNGKAMEEY